MCETAGVGDRIAAVFAAVPMEDTELCAAAAGLVLALTKDEGARKMFARAGVVQQLIQASCNPPIIQTLSGLPG